MSFDITIKFHYLSLIDITSVSRSFKNLYVEIVLTIAPQT